MSEKRRGRPPLPTEKRREVLNCRALAVLLSAFEDEARRERLKPGELLERILAARYRISVSINS